MGLEVQSDQTISVSPLRCDTCGEFAEHKFIEGLWFCMRCHPEVDPAYVIFTLDPLPVSDWFYESDLTKEIEQAAIKAGINPATGEQFTLDEIIERHATKRKAPELHDKITVSNGLREVQVPPECPIPPHLITSTWCDWADGWSIGLINGVEFREQPGPDHPSYDYSEGKHRYQPGWHVFGSTGKKILSVPSCDMRTLLRAWQRYITLVMAAGECAWCLGKGTMKQRHVDLPCPECNKDPEINHGHVVVPVWHERCPRSALEPGTWWRYQGKDMVVGHAESPNGGAVGEDGKGWVVLRAPRVNECARIRQAAASPVWVDDEQHEVNKWVPARQALAVLHRPRMTPTRVLGMFVAGVVIANVIRVLASAFM